MNKTAVYDFTRYGDLIYTLREHLEAEDYYKVESHDTIYIHLKKEGEKKREVISLHINPWNADDVWLIVKTGNKELIKPVYLKDKEDPETWKEIQTITDMVYEEDKKNIKRYVAYYYYN